MGKAAMREIMQVIPGADMGLISSAPHKQRGWEDSLEPYPVVPTGIPTMKGLPEPDIPKPKETAVGKLRSFAGRVDLKYAASVMNPRATGTICDVLFVARDEVQTTDREGVGAPIVIGAIGAILKASLKGGRPGAIEIFNTTGTARMADLVRYRGSIPPELIFSAWEEGIIAMSPRLIDLLARPKRLFELHRRGVVGPGIINPGSIAGINWPDLARWVPHIARSLRGGHRDISMEIRLGRHGYHYLSSETTTKDAESAYNELKIMTRGIPESIIPGIVNFYLQ